MERRVEGLEGRAGRRPIVQHYSSRSDTAVLLKWLQPPSSSYALLGLALLRPPREFVQRRLNNGEEPFAEAQPRHRSRERDIVKDNRCRHVALCYNSIGKSAASGEQRVAVALCCGGVGGHSHQLRR